MAEYFLQAISSLCFLIRHVWCDKPKMPRTLFSRFERLWSRQTPSREHCTRSATNLCSQLVTLYLCRMFADNKMHKKASELAAHISTEAAYLWSWNVQPSENVPGGSCRIERPYFDRLKNKYFIEHRKLYLRKSYLIFSLIKKDILEAYF